MDRYLLLIESYKTRDSGTLLLFCVAAASAAAWPFLDKYLPGKIKPLLIRTYSSGVLAVYVLVLIVNLLGG